MGMFDYIKYEAPCPKCGEMLDDWQSKDSECLLDTLEPWQVSHFYQSCPKCKSWILAKVDAEVEHIVNKCEITLSVER